MNLGSMPSSACEGGSCSNYSGVVSASDERALQRRYAAIMNAHQAEKSVLRRLNGFSMCLNSLSLLARQLCDDVLEGIKDRYFPQQLKEDTNKIFESFKAMLAKLQNECLKTIPKELARQVSEHEQFTTQVWKKRCHFKEKYQHYLVKVRRIAQSKEESSARSDPNRFILSAGTDSTISRNIKEPSDKLKRNNEKLLQAASSFRTFHEAASQQVEGLLKSRNVVISSITRVFAAPFSETIHQQPGCQNTVIQAAKFESNNSQEQESLESEIAIRKLLNIPVGINIPVIRRKSLQMNAGTCNYPPPRVSPNTKGEEPVPFSSSDPKILEYLRNLLKKSQTAFDFADFADQDKGGDTPPERILSDQFTGQPDSHYGDQDSVLQHGRRPFFAAKKNGNRITPSNNINHLSETSSNSASSFPSLVSLSSEGDDMIIDSRDSSIDETAASEQLKRKINKQQQQKSNRKTANDESLRNFKTEQERKLVLLARILEEQNDNEESPNNFDTKVLGGRKEQTKTIEAKLTIITKPSGPFEKQRNVNEMTWEDFATFNQVKVQTKQEPATLSLKNPRDKVNQNVKFSSNNITPSYPQTSNNNSPHQVNEQRPSTSSNNIHQRQISHSAQPSSQYVFSPSNQLSDNALKHHNDTTNTSKNYQSNQQAGGGYPLNTAINQHMHQINSNVNRTPAVSSNGSQCTSYCQQQRSFPQSTQSPPVASQPATIISRISHGVQQPSTPHGSRSNAPTNPKENFFFFFKNEEQGSKCKFEENLYASALRHD